MLHIVQFTSYVVCVILSDTGQYESTSEQNASISQIIARAATPMKELHVDLVVSFSHSILTPGQPVLPLPGKA